jgi:PAS domain S-box-containing protein
MDIKTLFALQIFVYAIFPFYLAILKRPARLIGFYIYLSLVLAFGGFTGAVYSFPLSEMISISGGNISYGAFMMTTILLIILERDIDVIRNVIRIVITVNIFKVLLFLAIGWALASESVRNPFLTNAALFQVSAKFVILGGALIILELLMMLYGFEYLKRKLQNIFVLSLLYVAVFIATLSLDGILFPIFGIGFSPELKEIMIGNIRGKFVLAASYSLPLLLFSLVFRKRIAKYSETPVRLPDLWNLPREKLVEEVSTQREALEASEMKYRELVELAQEGIWVIDKDAKTTFVNPSMEKMLRYDEGEMLGKELFSFMDERGIEIASKNVERRKEGIAEQHDFEFIRKDGERIIVTMQTAPITDKKGDYAGSIAGMINITKRKRMEEDLLSSEEKLRTTIENINDIIIWKMDEKGIYTYLSPAVTNILGYEPEEMEKTSGFSYFRPEDLPTLQKKMAERIAGESTPNELEMVAKDGSLVPMEFVSSAIKDEAGKVLGFSGIARDITERKLAGETLQAEAQRNEQILGTMLDGFVLADTEGQIIKANPAYCALVGYGAAELLQMNIRELEVKIPREEVERRIDQMVSLGSDHFETQHQHKNGQVIELDVNISIMQEGSAPLVAAFMRDITERKKAAEALQKSEIRLRRYFDQGLFGMAITSEEKKWIEINDALCEMFGYSREELLEMTWAEITYPEDLDANLLFFNQMATGEIDSYALDKRFLRKDGSILWAELSANAIRKDDGSVDYLITLINDVTERKEAESALKASHERMLTLLNSIPADIYVSELESYEIIFMNEHMKRNFGDELVGKICYQVLRGESGPCSICPHNNLIEADGNPAEMIVWEAQNPLSKRWNVNYDRAVPWTDGHLVHVQIAMDITERKQVENELNELNAKLDKRVEERTEELNTMVGLMSGREVRMAELKKVITQLREQLKKEGITPSAYDPLLGPDEEW